jgi:phosphomevalonate kinase
MESTIIIFLGYESLVGKDTVGEIMVNNYGFTRLSFADAMKEELAKQLNIDVKLLQIPGKEKEKYRKQMIEFAEAERAKNPFVWINKAFEPYMNPQLRTFKSGYKLVITDHRRESEVYWYYEMWRILEVQKLQWKNIPKYQPQLQLKLLHIIRPGIKDKDTLTHYALGLAKGIDLIYPGFIDATIHNDSTKERLKEKIENCLKSILI